jgi:glycosyltransferase involved in cell wall biosynthesis
MRQISLHAIQVHGVAGCLRKTCSMMKERGFRGLLERVGGDYSEWIRLYDTLDADAKNRIHERIARMERHPLISIVMPVYNPEPRFLIEAVESVQSQLYPYWELCIADDASTDAKVRPVLEQLADKDERIKIVFREENGHISRASNTALELAAGEFVALLDNDDLLPEHALFEVVCTILDHRDVGLIYSDEDKITETGKRFNPYFKSDLNYELLLAQNMISHLGVYRRDLLESAGGFRVGFEGSQDYDLALRVLEHLTAQQVRHIPRILYHWRAISGSTALASDEKNYAADAGRKAVAEHLQRRGLDAQVMPAPEASAFNRVRFKIPDPAPLVSIIIPTRDRVDVLATCINSIFDRTTYPEWEIILVDNGSVEAESLEYFAGLPCEKVRVVRNDAPFNFSALNNLGAKEASGELLCLMNNDIEIITPDWLEEMISFALLPDAGCVGARLWYPDGRLQHGGVLLGVGGVANHAHYLEGKGSAGYFGRAVLHQSFSAVTAACMVVRQAVYQQLGGLDETLAVAFNDVDFCLRVRDAGYHNIWTPYAEMIHHESVSRGDEDTPEKKARFNGEIHTLELRWKDTLDNDPAYNSNLSLSMDCSSFSLAFPPRTTPIA